MNDLSGRVVDKAEDGRGWAVRSSAGKSLAVHQLKSDAISDATQQLGISSTGGELRIFGDDGRLLECRRIDPQHRQVQPEGLVQQVDREGGWWDHGVLAVSIVLPLLGAGGAALISPEVAAADDWFGVFLATLAWSLGVGFSVFLLVTTKVSGWPAVSTVGFCLFASIFIASELGKGTLDLDQISAHMAQVNAPGPFRFIAAVTATAFVTFGFVGAILGGGIGAWLGWRIAQYVQSN